MKEVDQEEYKYLGVLQLDKTMNKETKESIGNEYIRRVKLICKSNLNAGNFISGFNAWATCVMRYSRGTRLDKRGASRHGRKTRKINRCLHPRSSVARLYMKQKEGGRGLIRVEYCITTERRGLLPERKIWKIMLSGALKENVIEEGPDKVGIHEKEKG